MQGYDLNEARMESVFIGISGLIGAGKVRQRAGHLDVRVPGLPRTPRTPRKRRRVRLCGRAAGRWPAARHLGAQPRVLRLAEADTRRVGARGAAARFSVQTTLAVALAKKLNLPVYYEPVIDNAYLQDFYADMARYSFPLQVYLLNRRFAQQQQIIWSGKGGVQDRTIYEGERLCGARLWRWRALVHRPGRGSHA